MRKDILQYFKPKTKEQIATNLVYLLRENKEMKGFKAFTLESTLNASNTDNVRWTFLEKILPELNDFFNELYKKYQLEDNKKEIEKLEQDLKGLL